ncbi:MAG TPA: ABC transporter ATP-binding protein [Pseudothermotoga sp.]|nr:ABC transporter ATP-binding protein [Pseudothermotoga sp.]HOK83890.1 ABC transporter ATP-binding protein [Pseudothermotoga sp.]HPP70209.1 ABC transporter ATP-binding protein [Pseudothermotoga sp.]
MSLLRVSKLKKYFAVKRSAGEILLRVPQRYVKAVDGISFEINEGETFGLVGESGSGKTTTGRLVLRLIEPTEGTIEFDGIDITRLSNRDMRLLRNKMQVIFQDPMAALNPYMKIGDAVKHGLEIHNIGKNEQERKKIVLEMLEKVNLQPEIYSRYPHELSGGQRQRVVIARALILKPRFVVADEALAMLDVSVRSQLLKLLLDLKREMNLTFLFITHDLATTKYMCNRIGVMYLGKFVEIGTYKHIYESPMHPYTKALISAIPEPDPNIMNSKKRFIPHGEVPNPINPPKGCRFHPRCPFSMDICTSLEPQLINMQDGRTIACHLYNSH